LLGKQSVTYKNMQQNIEELKLVLLKKTLSEIEIALDDFNLNSFDKYGNNILHYYVKNEKSVQIPADLIIELFIRMGININETQSKLLKRTPLHLAILTKSKNILSILLTNGADVNLKDANGNVALSHAVMNYRGEDDFFIKILLSHNADPDIANNYGVTSKKLAHTIANYDTRKFFS
jgi:ankyrin repeat protein